MTAINIIDYQSLLFKLALSRPNHLLLGNGFNNSLGIRTNYSEIFNHMKRDYAGYRKVESRIKNNGYDIEFLIKELKAMIQDDGSSFLAPYIERKVKMDFMKATNEIVRKNIKYVLNEKNESIYLLLRNFTSYFTLNFDPLLYLILMKLKKPKNNSDVLAIQSTFKLQQQYSSDAEGLIYTKIKSARESGELGVRVDDEVRNQRLRYLPKPVFTKIVKDYFKSEPWLSRDVEEACSRILREESRQRKEALLKANDGFLSGIFQPELINPNLFFLHGAFHIVKNGKKITKIAQTRNKAFLKRLEDIIHNESQEVICVFTGTTEDKVKEIERSDYLKKCLDELSNLNGSLVILGSSLDSNDNHIFNGINQSGVEEIYISSCNETKERDYMKALEIFTNNKSITLFDYKTISYNSNN